MSAGDWRTAVADSFDEQAFAIDVALEQLNEVHELLEARGRDRVCTELRAVTASLRSEATELRSDARALRVKPAGNGQGPRSTTRHRRGG